MIQAQVSYTDSCPLVLRYPVTGSLESLSLSSDVMIVECFTNNGLVREVGRRIALETGEPRSTDFLLQRLSVAVQRGNCASVLGGILLILCMTVNIMSRVILFLIMDMQLCRLM